MRRTATSGLPPSSDSEANFCVRRPCEMDQPDIPLDSSESDPDFSVRRRCEMDQPEVPLDSSASSSEAMVPLTVSQAVINKLLLDSSD